jgi:SM-20-related protein
MNNGMPTFEPIARDLRDRGFSLCTEFLPAATVAALRAEIVAAGNDFRAAGIGRDRDFQQDLEVRSDRIRWLDPQRPAQRDFLQRMDALRLFLNQQLLLGLFDYEAHFAHYDPGARYQCHRDTFASQGDRKPRRVVSSVSYLNADWMPDEGGELVIYDGTERELTRVLPVAGAAVFFLSEEFPHEVLAATRARYSIAGWFRQRGG